MDDEFLFRHFGKFMMLYIVAKIRGGGLMPKKVEVVYTFRPIADCQLVDMMTEDEGRVALQDYPVGGWILFDNHKYPDGGDEFRSCRTEEDAVRWVALGELP